MNDLSKVFFNTLEMCDTLYKDETISARDSARVVANPRNFVVTEKDEPQEIQFVKARTLEAARGQKGTVAVLNFADGIMKGGLVFQGAHTQEEGLCRCSNLYPTLDQSRIDREFYKYNKSRGGYVFSDRLVYSKDVLVFKDDATNMPLTDPYYVDVITCPAPATEVEPKVIENRIEGIITTAGHEGVDCLVLGAWGCGAYHQDVGTVAKAFRKVLDRSNFFEKVIFAIYSKDNMYERFINAYFDGAKYKMVDRP